VGRGGNPLPPDEYLGDIAICYERAVEQAEEYNHSLERELAFLAVHGSLHLMGYDHMTKEDEAAMFAKQEEVLVSLGLTRE
jgi:probable rRNA maturation factor